MENLWYALYELGNGTKFSFNETEEPSIERFYSWCYDNKYNHSNEINIKFRGTWSLADPIFEGAKLFIGEVK